VKGLTKISKIFALSAPFGKFSSILRRTPNSAQGGRFCAKFCARRITESWHPYPIWRMRRSPDPNHPRTAAEKRVMIWRGRWAVFVWGFGWSSVTTLRRLKIVFTATATCQQGKTVAELLTRNFQEYLDHVAVPAPGGSTLQWARQKICCAWHLFNCYRPTVIVDSSPYFWNSIFWILQALIPNPIQSFFPATQLNACTQWLHGRLSSE